MLNRSTQTPPFVIVTILSCFLYLLNYFFNPQQDLLYLTDPYVLSTYECTPPHAPPSLPLQLHWSSRKRRRQLQTYFDRPKQLFLDHFNIHGDTIQFNLTTFQLHYLRQSPELHTEQDMISFQKKVKNKKLNPKRPELWDPHQIMNLEEIAKPVATELPRFVLAWTTPQPTFTARQEAVIESIFYHHPRAHIVIYSNTLSITEEPFSKYVYLGYRMSIISYSKAYLSEKLKEISLLRPEYTPDITKINSWIDQWDAWKAGRYFYSHTSDLLRFVVLARYGGSWVDFDAIVVQTFDGYRNAIGRDISGTSTFYPECSWCLGVGTVYLAPGVLINWDQFHPMLVKALSIGFDASTYNPDCFNCVGPKAITLAYKFTGPKKWLLNNIHGGFLGNKGGNVGSTRRLSDSFARVKHRKDTVHVLEPFQLYPVRWDKAAAYTKLTGGSDKGGGGKDNAHRFFSSLRSTVLSFHLYGHMTNHLRLEKDCLVDLVVSGFRITSNVPGSRDANLDANAKEDELIVSINAPAAIAVNAPETNQNAQLLDGISLQLHYRVFEKVEKRTQLTAFSIHIESTSCEISFTSNSDSINNVVLEQTGTFVEIQVALSSILWHTDSSTCSTHHRGELIVTAFSSDLNLDNTVTKTKQLMKTIQIVHINELLTISLQTFGNAEHVDVIIDTIRSQLPEIDIVVTNDGPFGTHPVYSSLDMDPHVHYKHSKFDSGLGTKRNLLVNNVQTPYVMVMNDNMMFGPYSDILRWLLVCMQHNIDIASYDTHGITLMDKESTSFPSNSYALMTLETLKKALPIPYLVKHEILKTMNGGWNNDLKFNPDYDLFERALNKQMKVAQVAGIGFEKIEILYNDNNPWHLWFNLQSQRTEQIAGSRGSCVTGTQPNECEVCDDRHQGFLCGQCRLGHYGPECKPCRCKEGDICAATMLGNGECKTPHYQWSAIFFWILVLILVVQLSCCQHLCDGGVVVAS